MQKVTTILACLLFVSIIAGAYAGVVLYKGDLAHVTMTVKSPTVNFFTMEIELGELDSLQSFDSRLYDPPGKELAITDINLSEAIIYTENFSTIEKAAFERCDIYVKIYNETATLVEGEIDAIEDTAICSGVPMGIWDVSIRVYGKAGIPEIKQLVDFNVSVSLVHGNQSLCATTDENGNYFIPNVESGHWCLTASKEGFNSQMKHVFVEAGKNSVSDFVLEETGF